MLRWTSFEERKHAADGGDPRAQFALGLRYATGEGVVQNLTEGMEWIRRSAEAARLFLEAARKDVGFAQMAVARFFETATYFARNLSRAYQWYSIAARQGVPGAKRSLMRLDRVLTGDQRAEGEYLAARHLEY